MRLFTPFIGIFMLMNISSTAQHSHDCPSDEIHKKLIATSPEYREKQKELEKIYRAVLQNAQQNPGQAKATYNIPVVFHIMHNPNDPEGVGTNISLAKILTEINNWNAALDNIGDYAGNPDQCNCGIVSSDVDINFCLATQDPMGFPTDGVNRFPFSEGQPLYRDEPGLDTGSELDKDMQALINWNTEDYFNVWVVGEICKLAAGGPDNCAVAGYAYFPSASGQFYDGSVVEHDLIGINTNLSKVMVHEIGHYLNLYHTFNENCTETDCTTGGDRVCDTPPDSSTNSVNCNTNGTANTCSNDATITNSPFATDVDDMYQNYMDYGFQSCQNTFTPNQATRMEAVLMPGGGRNSLTNSSGCAAPSVNSAQVAFAMASRVSSEAVTTGVGVCEAYRDIEVMVKISQAPASAVTLTLNSTGTATVGRDFNIIDPTVTFTSAGALQQFATIRIYNDAVVEGNEAISLSYNIAGPASAAASQQTMDVVIKDDDVIPGLVVFTEDFESGTNGWTNSNFAGSWNFGQDNIWTVGINAGLGGNNAAYITTDFLGTKPYEYNNGAVNVVTRPLFVTPTIDASNASDMTLSFTYKANGSGNDAGYIAYTNGGGNFLLPTPYTNQSTPATASFVLPASLNGSPTVKLFFEWRSNADGVGENPPFAIDDITISVAGPDVESAVTSTDAYFGPNETIYIYASDGEIMAKLENTSSHDYGCTTISVDRAGSGESFGVANWSAISFLDKSFTVTPTNNNPAGSYDITLYYSEAELAGWEAADAVNNNRSNLEMVKTSGTIAGAQSANSVHLAPTVSGYGSDWAYTANFASGFSGFGLADIASSALPLDLISFDGRKQGKQVALNWLTENEINSSHFDIEHSIDGRIFEKIGYVKANNQVANAYNFDDNKPANGANYYRLKIVDTDGTSVYSNTVVIVFIPDFELSIHPNPTTADQVIFYIDSQDEGALTYQVRNVQGMQVANEQTYIQNGVQSFAVNMNRLPSGVYFLQVQKGQYLETKRFVKK